MAALASRAAQALRTTGNWVQLGKFLVVGASGYVINLFVYASLVGIGNHPSAGIGAHEAAAISFVVSASSNYWWNHRWTFARARVRSRAVSGPPAGSAARSGQPPKGNHGAQGVRFLVVSLAALGVNQLWLVVFIDWLDWRKVVAQAVAILLVTPLNFVGNKLWSFRR